MAIRNVFRVVLSFFDKKGSYFNLFTTDIRVGNRLLSAL